MFSFFKNDFERWRDGLVAGSKRIQQVGIKKAWKEYEKGKSDPADHYDNGFRTALLDHEYLTAVHADY